MAFSRSFGIEAKEFQVFVIGSRVVKFLEWSQKALNLIFLGRYGVCMVGEFDQ